MGETDPLRAALHDLATPVTHDVDRETGRLTIRCDAATFDRLRRAIQDAAGLGTLIHFPPVVVRSVAVEPFEWETVEGGAAAWLASMGCVAGLLAVAGVFGVGLWTVWGWVAG